MRLSSAFLWGSMVVFTAALYTPAAKARSEHDNVVFRIGTFDRSSAEFAQESPKHAVNFLVGQSNPAKDWYAAQPVQFISNSGALDTNKDAVPRAITFSLKHASTAAYQLHIAVLIESSSVPALRVSINGKYGTFYLHPTLDDGMGDWANTWFPIYSHADVRFSLSGDYLHQGVNTITLQVVEEVDTEVPDASLTYDALELDCDTGSARAPASSAQVLPTIFYQDRQGNLEEIVEVLVRHGERVKMASSVDLDIANKRYHQALRGGQDFGEEKVQFSVAEFPPQTLARLAWNIDGHWRRSEQSINPGKKWTLFLVPNVHLDVGYTDYQAKVAALHSRVIDEALDQVARHPDFRFSIDGEWSLAQFLKTRTLADQQRLIAAVQKQQLFVPPQYVDMLTGFPTAETLIRSLYAGAAFSQTHDTPFNYANLTDTPTVTWSYASILAAAGIKQFLMGGNNILAPVWLQGHLSENSPMWWKGPDGQKVLLWYARHYQHIQVLFGLPPVLSAGYDTLPLFLQMYERPNYRANATILFGSQVENTDLFPQQAELAERWNSVYAYPRLQYSGFHDALKNIADQFGDNIPTVSGDGGSYWEIAFAADAQYAAMERENESRAPSAEELSTLSSLVNPSLVANKQDLDRMWEHMVVMDEHVSSYSTSVFEPTSVENVRQLEVKESQAIDARALADSLARNSMASIADSISSGEGSLIVFNTLNWERSGPVSIDLTNGDEIVDTSTNQVVAVEIIDTGNGMHHVRFVAENVPAVGYKVFLLRHNDKLLTPSDTVSTSVLESPYYHVELDPATGAVRSVYDKQLQRELVNQQSPYRFGEYLYVTGGDAPLNSHLVFQRPSTLLQYPLAIPQPELHIHPAHDGRLVSVTRTPSGWIARMESTDTNTPAIISEIRLFDREKKIEFVEDVNKNEVDSKEGVYFAFPFAMDRPQFQYEIQTGVVDPAKDMYPGAGHEWFSVQHWVSTQQDGLSATVMPLDVPLVTLGDINRGVWPAQFGERPGTIFSYAINNYWYTGTRGGQGGHFHFRYLITSAPSTDCIHLSRMGWEEMTPLEANEVISQDKALNTPRPLNGKQDSFLDVSDPELVLTTWKPAEDGNGTILRILDLGGAVRSVTIQTPLLLLKEAWQTDAVERNGNPLSLIGTKGFQFTIHPREIVTVRIVGDNVLPAPTH
ncbi:MAG: polysaccharide lyase family protein [Terriglobales bacterium]